MPGGSRVEVCEHILAACFLHDLDDVDILFEGDEAPIVDGSAGPFVHAMRQAGVAGPPASAGLSLAVTWQGRTVTWTGGLAPSRARTFIQLRSGAALLNSGLFPGARPGCSLVLDPMGASRYGARPRLPFEAAWHKLIDLMGDLGPHRARGRLQGALHVIDPAHASNGDSIEAALADGRLNYLQELERSTPSARR